MAIEAAISYQATVLIQILVNIAIGEVKGIYEQTSIATLSISSVENVRFINCTLKDNYVHFDNIKEEGICYPTTNLLFNGTKFQEKLPLLVHCEEGTRAKISVVNSMDAGIISAVKGDVVVGASDVSL